MLRGREDVYGLKGVHVLVVEDSPSVLEMFTLLLRAEGADVAGAVNGRDALALFEAHHFDLLVSDLGLPDIPGEVLIRAIVSAARGPLEVVVITGDTGSSLIRASDAGAGAIFAKPCEWGVVLKYINALALGAAA
jgi:two-component system, OmpR family, KDP operon response regulator KdpE